MLQQFLAAAERKTRSQRAKGNAGGVTRGHTGPSYESTALASSSHPATEDASSRLVSEERGREDGFHPWSLPHRGHMGAKRAEPSQ